jgi:hypothetical protein
VPILGNFAMPLSPVITVPEIYPEEMIRLILKKVQIYLL